MPMMYYDCSSNLLVVLGSDQSNSLTKPPIVTSLEDGPFSHVYFVEIKSKLNEVADLYKYWKFILDNAELCTIMVDMKNVDVESLKEARQKNAEIHILIADESWKINTQNLLVCVHYGCNINITSLMRDRHMFLKNLSGEEACNSGVDSSIGRKGSDIKVKSGVGESKVLAVYLIGYDIGNIDVKKFISTEVDIMSLLHVSSACKSCASLCSNHLFICIKSEYCHDCCAALKFEQNLFFSNFVSFSLMRMNILSYMDRFQIVKWLMALNQKNQNIFCCLDKTGFFHLQLYGVKMKHNNNSLLPCNALIEVVNCSALIRFAKSLDVSCANMNDDQMRYFENNTKKSMENVKNKRWTLHVHATALLTVKRYLKKQIDIQKPVNNVLKTMDTILDSKVWTEDLEKLLDNLNLASNVLKTLDTKDSQVWIEERISICNLKYSMEMFIVKIGSLTAIVTRNKVIDLLESLDVVQYECHKSILLHKVICTPEEFGKIVNISSVVNSINDTAMNHVLGRFLEMKMKKIDDIFPLVFPSQLLEMYCFEKNVRREEKFFNFPETIHTSIVCAEHDEQTLIESLKLNCIKALIIVLLNSYMEDESEILSLVDMNWKITILTDFIGTIKDKLVLKNILMSPNSLYHNKSWLSKQSYILYKSNNVSNDESLEIDILWNIPHKKSILSDFIGNIEDKQVLKTVLDTLCLYKIADDETVTILNGTFITLKECVGHMLCETDEHNEERRSLFNSNLESPEVFSDQYTFCRNQVFLLTNAIYKNDDDVSTLLTWLLDNLYEDRTSKIIERKEEKYFIEEMILLRILFLFFTGTLCNLRYIYQKEKFMNFHSCKYENYHRYLLQLWLSRNTNFTELFHIYNRTAYSIDNQIPYMQRQEEIKHSLWNYMTTYRPKSLHNKLVKAHGKLRNVRICRSANICLPTPAPIDKDNCRDNCQLSCEFYALLGISYIIAQVTLVVLKKILLIDNSNHETKSREKTVMNLCLLSCLVSFKQVIYSYEAHTQEDRTIYFPGKGLSKTTHQEIQSPGKNVMLKEMVKGVLTSDCKSVKSILYDIINHDEIFRNVEITAYPVNGYNGMSNEILRVGSLNTFPSENSPSLIKLAKYGFYYEGKGREVTCFSCGIKHGDWSYRSNPLEVHRQISPYCEYLKTLAPSDQPVFRPPIEIIENDCRHNATPRMPTTEIPYQNGIGTDSIHTCTDAHGTPMTVAVQSVDSGLFGSSLSHSSNNLVTSNSTSISSISQRSSRASTDSGFGSRGSISTDNSSSSNHNSNLAVPQLPPLLEGGEHSIQRVSGPASRDSPIPQNNRKNTPKEKYPEYIPIERRRATYKNWPPNLDFLHPLDLSECGFFYSNFGDCVRCFHCGIGLRNWESDDNPWVEHARWSRKCPYLLQRKGQEFIDSVLSVLGLQTDSEIEMQTAYAGTEAASQVSSGYGTASSNDVRDPICHPAAQYIIRENIFGDNKEKQVKKTMNQLLQNHEWDDITNDMLVNALLESKDIMENLDTKTNSLNLSESAVSNSSESSNSTTPSTGTDDKNKEEESKKSTEENPEKIQKENEELKELYTCKICLDERVGITFVPCGHLVTCKTCSPKIRRCPLCRTFIRGTIKTTM